MGWSQSGYRDSSRVRAATGTDRLLGGVRVAKVPTDCQVESVASASDRLSDGVRVARGTDSLSGGVRVATGTDRPAGVWLQALTVCQVESSHTQWLQALTAWTVRTSGIRVARGSGSLSGGFINGLQY